MFSFRSLLPKTRKFEYIPRYYDPKKEAREERLRKLKGDNIGDVRARISSSFEDSRRRGRSRSSRNRQSNMTLFILIVILSGLSYFFIKYYLTDLLHAIF